MALPEDVHQACALDEKADEDLEKAAISAIHGVGSYQTNITTIQGVLRTEIVGKMLFKALSVAVLGCLLLGTVVKHFSGLRRSTGRLIGFKYSELVQPPSDSTVRSCMCGFSAWEHTANESRLALEMPRQSNNLYLFTKGVIPTAGKVDIEQDEALSHRMLYLWISSEGCHARVV